MPARPLSQTFRIDIKSIPFENPSQIGGDFHLTVIDIDYQYQPARGFVRGVIKSKMRSKVGFVKGVNIRTHLRKECSKVRVVRGVIIRRDHRGII